MSERTNQLRAGFALTLIAAATLASALGGGCDDSAGPQQLLLATSSGSGGSDGGGAPNLGEEMFHALEADLVKECGACHKLGGLADTPFLGDPDSQNPAPYDVMTSWPDFVVKDWATSLLVSWPAAGSHSGPAPSETLGAALEAWLAEEAKAVEDVANAPSPTIAPKKPIMGFNSLYLDALGADFTGMAITFWAEELTDKSLALTEIQLYPTPKLGLKFEHPLFVVYPIGTIDGEPDPIDSFSNVAGEVEAGKPASVGPGTLVLSNWKKGAKLSLAFDVLEVVDPAGGGGGMGGGGGGDVGDGPCQALDAFTAEAAPALSPCVGCHGGGNGAATNAVDMSDLDNDLSSACGQILNRINLNNPPQSQLFVTTNPQGGASHPFKFGGNTNNFNNFVNAVTKWVQAESP